MKKISSILLCCALVLGLMGTAGTTKANAVNNLTMNGKTRVTVAKDQTVTYNFTMGTTGGFNLMTSTTTHDRANITIKILDSNNNELAKDTGKWEKNKLNDSMNDLQMPLQLPAGNYKVTFFYEGDNPTWSYDVETRYLPITSIPTNTSWKLRLYEDEQVVYKVNVPANGHYVINTTANCSPYDVYFYILDAKGNEVDDDDTNPDWSEDKATGMKKMNWITEPLTKGQYYIKVVNETDGILDLPIKITYKIPATKITLKKTSIKLEKGKKYTIKATLTPAKTTDTLKFTSSNKKIATVSKNGVITAKKKGKATITVKATSGAKKKIKVTVKK